MNCYQPNYPRPQFVRDKTSWQNLNGPWDFAFDNAGNGDANEGIAKKWFASFPAGQKITVPFAFESPASGITAPNQNPARHDVVWYRKEIAIASEKLSGRVFLHFEGSDYNTRLWVNGEYAGSHDGAYSRFSFDITHLVKPGTNTLTVRAEDSFDISQPRGKQRWRNESYDCFYIQTTGIWKTVWLEYTGLEYLKSVKMTPVFSKGILEIEAEFEAIYPDYELEALISFNGTFVSKTSVSVTGKILFFTAAVFTPAIQEHNRRYFAWSPEKPNLYDISFTLKKNGKPIDEVLSYFGMRELRIEGSHVLLNGVPLYQKLILDQGYWKDSHMTPPDEKALITDIDSIISAGFNGARKHQKAEEQFLYWADVKGLLVWSEMAAAYEYNDNAVTAFTKEWMEVVRQNYNHPSIITWTPFNESWGIPNVKTDKQQQAFTEAIYHLTKAYDIHRPVICNDGWEHTISDIITLHDYIEKGEDFLALFGGHLDAILANEQQYCINRFAFANGYSYTGQPIILSEYGGIAFNDDRGFGYGNKVNTKEEYLNRFDAITTAVKKVHAISGYCYTQVTDIQQEINGIMDMDRNFKVDSKKLKEINEKR